MRKLGYLPDPPDARDLSAGAILQVAATPPAEASVEEYIVDVLDQGALGSCVANAIMQAVRVSHVKSGIATPKLGSRLFGYWTSRAFHSATNEDNGTYLRTFFQALNRFGFCPEDAWPYDDASDAWKKPPPHAAFRRALDQASPTTYRRIASAGATRIDEIKRAIAGGYAVCFGTDVTVEFAKNSIDPLAPLPPPAASEPIAGGHAMCVVGYEVDDFLICNSWGQDWGDDGYCYFSADYLAWGQTRDIWLVEKAPNYSE